jgi:hypothetical protein
LIVATLAFVAGSDQARALATRTSIALRGTVTDTSVQGAPSGNGSGVPSTIEGRGRFNQLGNVSEKGRVSGYPVGHTFYASGHLTLYVATGGSISTRISGTDEFIKNGTQIRRKADFRVTGGTGRFAHAAGHGTIRALCPNDINSAILTCRSTWKGTLSYPRATRR